MLKKVITTALAIMLVGIIGFALRLWLIKESVDQINTAIMDTATKNMNRLKTTASQLPMPTQMVSSDQQPPSSNPQDWDSISNKQQICWIHKKTHRKVCEQKNLKAKP